MNQFIDMDNNSILIEGARQNNLKNLDVSFPTGALTVVTGVSGSGKSSLVFDILYSEGQRRYVETFSAYARQFLERMDKPRVDRVEGIPPAIAIDQNNPVRTSRSTVGTMTELNDHLKLLFARAAVLHCRGCGKTVSRDTPQSILTEIENVFSVPGNADAGGVVVTFPLQVPHNFSEEEIRDLLNRQGYTRIYDRREQTLEVVQDRVAFSGERRERILEALETALEQGKGRATVHIVDENRQPVRRLNYSSQLHCADCDVSYRDPFPNLFSFNSPAGACDTCRGFGRIMGIDYGLVIPDPTKTLRDGAVRPWQSDSYQVCQIDLLDFADERGVPVDVPWQDLTDEQREWVIEGEGDWGHGCWYGVRRFFDWLERRSYRMHIRVLLSRYRSYTTCPDCHGARLKPEALLWRITGECEKADAGMNIHDVMLMPIHRCYDYFRHLHLPAPLDEATDMLLKEIISRLYYLDEVGLGYLTLDRQSRTLSGGEVQRINLTTALGTSLVNTLFVLDEPSIGLHPRDIGRLIRILHRLRDAGNTLVVVEHDPQVIAAADYVLDMGPGPGEAGGEKVFFGSVEQLFASTDSITAAYLRGEKDAAAGLTSGYGSEAYTEQSLTISGCKEHNLKNIDVCFPLHRLVCVTGVSGSGKSTLVQDTCYRAVRKLHHKPTEPPGAHHSVDGHDLIEEVVLVDQSPIGKSTRSNPATYVGALDALRTAFSRTPLARERGYKPGRFSFNSPKGQCPTCRGNGFEHVEMQFLSDVYVRCPDCNGARYRPEILDIKILPAAGTGQVNRAGERFGPQSIADVLEMTVNEACDFFADHPAVCNKVQPLRDVGLGYVKLGQPVPSLSGGEAQRLKLAGHLAEHAGGRAQDKGKFFLLDEPTTGLHFEDIGTLLRALRQLVDAGNSVVVVEHNVDVMRAADWLIDLGPEGGEEGGQLVFTGTPRQVVDGSDGHTAAALRAVSGGVCQTAERHAESVPVFGGSGAEDGSIVVHHAREHNLKGTDITLPRDRFTVITGVSGSGKSTLAFDILFAEGQRRYLESLNAYARQVVQPAARPDVDAVTGVPPTVAIEQRTSRGGPKSTVATVTEIYHFLRLLYVKLGTQHCPDCDIPIQAQPRDAVVSRIRRDFHGVSVRILSPLIVARKGYYTDLAKWAGKKGYEQLRVDGEMQPVDRWPRLDRYKEHNIELPVAEIHMNPGNEEQLRTALDTALTYSSGTVYVAAAGPDGNPERDEQMYSTKRVCRRCGRNFSELDPRLFSFHSKHGWCTTCHGRGYIGGARQGQHACSSCNGARLCPEALAVKFREQSIAGLTARSVNEAQDYFDQIELGDREQMIARDIVAETRTRLAFLRQVGLGYLTLDRGATTLSGGEAQRIRLAAQLGSNLRGVCYILDEPTIGLHARDNRLLLDTLRQLEEKGNTVVVVEHDEDTIRNAEYVLDLGPDAGAGGGEVVAEGGVEDVVAAPHSRTGHFLSEPLLHPVIGSRRGPADQFLKVRKADMHNLKRVDVSFPRQRLVCVTGVSGSGKSTLVRDVLHRNLYKRLKRNRSSREGGNVDTEDLEGCRGISGGEVLTRSLEVDQAPIGKTPRSCPATYVGFWDRIRKIFAETPEARMRGFDPGRFSFNTSEGRCPECEGQGVKKIQMSFLPDVTVPCDACDGHRFTEETLAARIKEYNVADVLEMSVDEAEPVFASYPSIHRCLRLLQDIGLGYLKLGQQSPTLSGGEAQRIKLVTELAKAHTGVGRKGHTLYVLEEPTIGLHMADIVNLVNVLHQLVEAGNTVVVIEHNLDVIAEGDWVIDLGPEGGGKGGRVVAAGTPDDVANAADQSYTGAFLADFLSERRKA